MKMEKGENPADVVMVGDHIEVYVSNVDLENNRLSLSLLSPDELAKKEGGRRNSRRGRKEEPKEVTMEDAMARLMNRFGH